MSETEPGAVSFAAAEPAEQIEFGVRSSTGRLRDVLVKRPGPAFGAAFDEPAYGFLHAVDLEVAQREHDGLVEVLTRLGARVHELGVETADPDLVYQYDPLIVASHGTIPLRGGKANRVEEGSLVASWTAAHGIPEIGRISAPGTVDGGDTVWVKPGIFCAGRSLRTNRAGITQLAALMAAESDEVHLFDMPYGPGPDECLHLMSSISPIADDLAVVFLPLMPAGLYELLRDHSIRMIDVPEEEYATQGSNVLAAAPGVAVVVHGNPVTRRALEAAGCEVHAFEGREIAINGTGGPTCLTRPLRRD